VSPEQRRKTGEAAPLTFRGPPHRLSSLVPLPDAAPSRVEVEGRLEGTEIDRLAVRPLRRDGLPVGRATLRLPKSTPPGTYRGSVAIAGREVPVVAEVEPRPRIEAVPSPVSLEVEPGGEATVEVTLLNLGNVPMELPAASTFCVFDGSGLDHAFWLALGSDPPEGKERIDVLLDDLARSHGGLVEVRVRAESRSLAPGQSSEAQVTLRFADRLHPGRSYRGTWNAEGLRLSVRVTVPERKRARRKAGEAS
jgi:hypothetical protein